MSHSRSLSVGPKPSEDISAKTGIMIGAGARGLDHAALFLASTKKANLILCGNPLQNSVFDPSRPHDYRGVNVPTAIVDKVKDEHVSQGMHPFIKNMRDDSAWQELKKKPKQQLSHAEVGAVMLKRFWNHIPKNRISIVAEAKDVKLHGEKEVEVETADGQTYVGQILYLTSGAVPDLEKPWLNGVSHPGLIHVSMAMGEKEEAHLRQRLAGKKGAAVAVVGGGPVTCDALVALNRVGFQGPVKHISGRKAPEGLPDMDFDRADADDLRRVIAKAKPDIFYGEASVALRDEGGFETTIFEEDGSERKIIVDQVIKPCNSQEISEKITNNSCCFISKDYHRKVYKIQEEEEKHLKFVSGQDKSILIQSEQPESHVLMAFSWIQNIYDEGFSGHITFVAPRSLEIDGENTISAWKEEKARLPEYRHVRDRAKKLSEEPGANPLKITLQDGGEVRAEVVLNCSGSTVTPAIYKKAEGNGLLQRNGRNELIPGSDFVAISRGAGSSGTSNPNLWLGSKLASFDPSAYFDFARTIEESASAIERS